MIRVAAYFLLASKTPFLVAPSSYKLHITVLGFHISSMTVYAPPFLMRSPPLIMFGQHFMTFVVLLSSPSAG